MKRVDSTEHEGPTSEPGRWRWDVWIVCATPHREKALGLQTRLEPLGLRAGCDASLTPGDDWTRVIPAALAEAPTIIVIWDGRPEDWQQREAIARAVYAIGDDTRRRLFPIGLCEGDAHDPPFGLMRLKWAFAPDWEAAVGELAIQIADLARAPGDQPPPHRGVSPQLRMWRRFSMQQADRPRHACRLTGRACSARDLFVRLPLIPRAPALTGARAPGASPADAMTFETIVDALADPDATGRWLIEMPGGFGRAVSVDWIVGELASRGVYPIRLDALLAPHRGAALEIDTGGRVIGLDPRKLEAALLTELQRQPSHARIVLDIAGDHSHHGASADGVYALGQRLVEWLDRHAPAHIPVLVLCRPWRETPSKRACFERLARDHGFRCVSVMPLSEEQQTAYLVDRGLSPSHAEAIRRYVRLNRGFSEIASRPRDLEWLARLYSQAVGVPTTGDAAASPDAVDTAIGRLPGTKRDLADAIADQLIDDIASRAIDPADPRPLNDAIRRVCERFALNLHAPAPTAERPPPARPPARWQYADLGLALRAAWRDLPRHAARLDEAFGGFDPFLEQLARADGGLLVPTPGGGGWRFDSSLASWALVAAALERQPEMLGHRHDEHTPGRPHPLVVCWQQRMNAQPEGWPVSHWSEVFFLLLPELHRIEPVIGLLDAMRVERAVEVGGHRTMRREPAWDGDDLARVLAEWARRRESAHGSAELFAALVEWAASVEGDRELQGRVHYALSALAPGSKWPAALLTACGLGPAPTLRGGPDPGDIARIEPGAFVMGSPPEEIDAHFGDEQERWREDLYVREQPRPVQIERAFGLTRTPITVDVYRRFDPRYPERDGRLPATGISWWEARLCAAWLNGRLPSEQEWEYACRAGGEGAFSCLEQPGLELSDVAWYGESGDPDPRPVAGLEPNPWGLWDMHGNVWEWVCDWFDRPVDRRPDPQRDKPDFLGRRVAKGGSVDEPALWVRSAARSYMQPGARWKLLGFRVAFDPEG